MWAATHEKKASSAALLELVAEGRLEPYNVLA
jgi:hypothetical protein